MFMTFPNQHNCLGSPASFTETMGFSCRKCGDCCINRAGKPIILTTADLYAIAQNFQFATLESLFYEPFLTLVLDKNTGFPFVQITLNEDDSCYFYKNGLCLVHQVAPVTCKLFPLIRTYDTDKTTFQYFRPANYYCIGQMDFSNDSVGSWISNNDVTRFDPENILFESAVFECLQLFKQITHKQLQKQAQLNIVTAFYGDIHTDRPLLLQLEENVRILKKQLKSIIEQEQIQELPLLKRLASKIINQYQYIKKKAFYE